MEPTETPAPNGVILLTVGLVNGRIALWVAPFLESRPVLQEQVLNRLRKDLPEFIPSARPVPDPGRVTERSYNSVV